MTTTPSSGKSSLPVIGQTIPYDRFLDCVHCGLCTAACPTYVVTGNENDGPRGRIYLMRAVVDGRMELTDKVRHHLELCLDCRSCETACPSGVQYGRLIEPFRVEMEQPARLAERSDSRLGPAQTPDWFQRWILHGLFPSRSRMKWALMPARWMQRLRLDRLAEKTGLTRLLPERLQRMQAQLPTLKAPLPELPEFLPAKGRRRARVALFIGCVADVMFRHVHWATARVLQENGCDVVVPRRQACCGAIHYHSGAAEPARSLMTQNEGAFQDADLDAIIVNVAGCGAMLKDYAHISEELLHLKNGAPAASASDSGLAAFCSRVKDIHEFLMALGPIQPEGRLEATVAYQDACHLQHAQKIRQQPRDLLRLIPGVTLRAINEAELCCGAAGSYNLTQPEMADQLGQRKLNCLLEVKPDVIVSGNAGCSLQLQAQLRRAATTLPVVHPVELLDLSYRNRPLSDLNKL
ncbi:MAG: (Fe-S)-binding protein [Planctomycetota bacterium]